MSGAPTDEVAAELARLAGEQARLREERARREAAEQATLTQLQEELTRTQGETAVAAEELAKVKARLQEMEAERRVVLPWTKRSWKAVQNLIRGGLSACVLVGLLALPATDVTGWNIFLLGVLGSAAVWWGGDLADYLELSRDE